MSTCHFEVRPRGKADRNTQTSFLQTDEVLVLHGLKQASTPPPVGINISTSFPDLAASPDASMIPSRLRGTRYHTYSRTIPTPYAYTRCRTAVLRAAFRNRNRARFETDRTAPCTSTKSEAFGSALRLVADRTAMATILDFKVQREQAQKSR